VTFRRASDSARSSSRAIGRASRPSSGLGNAGSGAWASCFARGCSSGFVRSPPPCPPTTPATACPPGAARAGGERWSPASGPPPAWSGFRPLRVSRKGREVISLVLEPIDGQLLTAALTVFSLLARNFAPRPVRARLSRQPRSAVSGVLFPGGGESPTVPRVRSACPGLWPTISGISVRAGRVSGAGLCSPFFNFHFGGAETGSTEHIAR
jgi:hypothetical protein